MFCQQLMKDDSSLISLTEKHHLPDFFYHHPHKNLRLPLRLEEIIPFKWCLTHFLLISTMSVIKLPFHIKFLGGRKRGRGEGVGGGGIRGSPIVSFPSFVLGEYEGWENYQSSEIQL